MTHEVLSQSHVAVDQKNGQFGDRHGDSEEAVFLEPFSTVHSIILDWTSATFIDSVGAKAIRQVLALSPALHRSSSCMFSLNSSQCFMVSSSNTKNYYLFVQVIKEYAAVDVRVVIAGCNSK